MTSPAPDLSWLPKFTRQIARVAGLDAALALAAAHGGTRIYIPRNLPADHWLITLVGQDAAQRMAREFGGEGYNMDHHPTHGIKGMRRAAERALDEQLSANEAARISGLHVRSIYARKAKRRADAQPGLFDGDA